MNRRDLFQTEDRHGNPGGLYYLRWVSIFAAVLALNIIVPADQHLRWAEQRTGLGLAVWVAGAITTLAAWVALIYFRHAALFRFRWYRRMFRRGQWPYAVGTWLSDAAIVWGALFGLIAALRIASML